MMLSVTTRRGTTATNFHLPVECSRRHMQQSTAVSFSSLFAFIFLLHWSFSVSLLLGHLLVLAGKGGTKRKTAYGLVGVYYYTKPLLSLII
jgi:hypothetical protein